MIQLEIASYEDVAIKYRKNLWAMRHPGIVKIRLQNIADSIPDGIIITLKADKKGKKDEVIDKQTIKLYIETIKKRYESLILLHPKGFNKEIQRFEKIISHDRINRKLNYGGQTHPSLSKQIISVLGYEEVRKSVYPDCARDLKIKSCVYCNANYAISSSNGEGYYDLDHWKPKSKYPFLCTSFYNLQISCASCNRRKSDSDVISLFRLWSEVDKKNLKTFRFYISRSNIADYWINHNSGLIDIKFGVERIKDQHLLANTESRLDITMRYKEHTDEVEEMLWRAKAYNEGYMASLNGGLVKLGLSNTERRRFILGTYPDINQIHERPLSLMKHDVSRCAGLYINKEIK